MRRVRDGRSTRDPAAASFAAERIRVLTSNAAARRGVVAFGWQRFACALGRSGLTALKREGDGATPRGRYRLEHLMYRPELGVRPASRLPARPMKVTDGWCDDVRDRNYNRRVRQPYPASAEWLWREDALYDVIVITNHNRCPRVRGHGSAIFLHVARPDFAPTAGCIAMRRRDLLQLLARLGRAATIDMARIDRPARP